MNNIRHNVKDGGAIPIYVGIIISNTTGSCCGIRTVRALLCLLFCNTYYNGLFKGQRLHIFGNYLFTIAAKQLTFFNFAVCDAVPKKSLKYLSKKIT